MGKNSKIRMMWVATACATLGLVGCGDEDGLSPYDAAVVSDGGDAAGGSTPMADAAGGSTPMADAGTDAVIVDAAGDGAVGDALGDGGGDAAGPTAQ